MRAQGKTRMTATATKPAGWRIFWPLYVIGWGLLAAQAAINGPLSTAVSPNGILDHQVAGTAARVNEIQAAWAAAGALQLARWSMGVDLAFISFATVAGLFGAVLIFRDGQSAALRALAATAGAAMLVFGIADFTETISQIVQATSTGSDTLAALAASVNAIKIGAFLFGSVALIAALIWRGMGRRRAAA